MASKAIQFAKVTSGLGFVVLMAMGCSKGGDSDGNAGGGPLVPGRVRSFAGQSGASYLNYLEVGFNTPWKAGGSNGVINTFFRNNKGSLPAFADTPLSSTSVRIFMGLAYVMATNGLNGDTTTPRKVFAHLNLTQGPIIGLLATNQIDAQVVAFLNHLCARFWNRSPNEGEMTDLKALWNGLAVTATNSAAGTRDTAVRVAATIASSPQALMQVQ